MTKKKSKKYESFKFPYETFPICVQHYDSDTFKVCWFQCKDHMKKYIKRHKFKQPDFIAEDVWGNNLNPVKPKRKTTSKKKPVSKKTTTTKTKSKKDILTPKFSTIDSFFKN